MSVLSTLHELIQPLVDDLGLELVGIEYHPHATNGIVRVYVDDSGQGIMLDQCARLSRDIGALLDVNDPIPGHYQLEVSSPGLDRLLFTLAQFDQFKGRQVKVHLLAPEQGRRKFTATIESVTDQSVRFADDKEHFEIAYSNVAKARLVPVFD